MKKELLKADDLKKIFDQKGFILTHMPKKPTRNRTKIHSTSCNNLKELVMERYGMNLDKKLGETNGQKYYHYDSFDEAMKEYPQAEPCKICNDGINDDGINDDGMKDDEITPLHYNISNYPADFTLEVLYMKWKNSEIIIPAFQRGFVWNLVQSSRLIESFLMGLPIPSIFLYTGADEKYLVIDGSQRLRTIFFFFDGFFGDISNSKSSRVFRLEGINPKSQYFRKTFEDFDDSEKRKLKNQILRAVVIQQLVPKDDDTSIYHIFERLNTGGTILKDQEVRNCVYSGKLNDLLIDLNKYPSWRKILGKPNINSRQKDVQLILRYMALFHNSDNYKKPMKDFLSTFMSKNRNADETFLENERKRFIKTCDVLIDRLGKKPLHPKGALNASFFDSIFVAFAKHCNSIQDDIKHRFEILKNDEIFQVKIGGATTDPEVVQSRLRIAEEKLFG